jgi:preprotein translocase subunit YajC
MEISQLLTSLLPWVAIFGIFWFLFIRPQKKQKQEHQEMVSNLKAGDEVTTIGGIKGKIAKVTEEKVRLEVASGVEVEMLKSAIRSLDNNETDN